MTLILLPPLPWFRHYRCECNNFCWFFVFLWGWFRTFWSSCLFSWIPWEAWDYTSVELQLWPLFVVVCFCFYVFVFNMEEELGQSAAMIVQLLKQKMQIWFSMCAWCLSIICNSSSRISDIFWLPWAPHMQVVHRQTCRQNIYTH